MAANVPAVVRSCVPILGRDLVWEARRGNENREWNAIRGRCVAGGAKALVDSLPPQRRTDVIKTLESVFRGMNADYRGRHSFDLPPESTGVLDPPSPKPRHVPIQMMNLKTRTTNRSEEENELHVEAIAGDGGLPHVDGIGSMVVRV